MNGAALLKAYAEYSKWSTKRHRFGYWSKRYTR